MIGIVVEGPDGSGKTTLVKSIMARHPGHIKHIERPATHDGPIGDVAEWTENYLEDITSSQDVSIVDRHPLISELIYGPICKGKISPKFSDNGWVLDCINRLIKNTIVIWALPPLEVVVNNLISEPQMNGVYENITKIWHAYRMMMLLWPGNAWLYDYTDRSHTQSHEDVIQEAISIVVAHPSRYVRY